MEYDGELYEAAMSAALRIFRKAYKRSHHSVTRDIWDAEIPLEEEETHVLHHALSVLESMERPAGPAPEVDLPYLGGSLFDGEEELHKITERMERRIEDLENRDRADRHLAIERLSNREMWTQLQGYMSKVDKLQDRSARLQGRISDLEESRLHVEHHDRLRKRVRHLEQKLEIIAEGRLSALDGQGISGEDSDG